MANNSVVKNTSLIRKLAFELGFTAIGFSKAEKLDAEARRLENWLNQNHHGEMGYMENHFDLRIDPSKLVPGAKSVVSFLYNYHNPVKQKDPLAPKISSYAYGRDYHKVIKKKLKILLRQITEQIGQISGRAFVDSAPVLERDLAKRAGLGWIGKHTLLISKQKGSNFFVAELILDLELEYDSPIRDYCGTCTKCIDACPTDAIHESGYVLDAKKCISYLTIELKDAIPEYFTDKMENWMFGCDICQDVCPWNRFSKMHQEQDFLPKEELINKTSEEWQEITEEVFDQLFIGSAVKRTKYEGLKRNIRFLKS